MVEFIGSNGSLALFGGDTKGVVVDTTINLVTEVGDLATLAASRDWSAAGTLANNSTYDLVSSAIVTSNVKGLVASASRMYTIPGNVQAEAKKAIKWHNQNHRGGTPVGLATAHLLAKGGQISLQKIRHIAAYFPRHEVDKKAEGYNPGETNFPSNGRIAWALWGGDGAQRWASAIVERENKKALTAAGYELPGYEDSLAAPNNFSNIFQEAHDLDENVTPEFIARIRHDGSGIDRLYKVEADGTVYLWDDCSWDNLGHVDGDIYSYDADLDSEYDMCDKTHVIIDPSSAIIISSLLASKPFQTVSLEEVNPEEAQLVADALEAIDWTLVERAMTAAGSAAPAANSYDSAERSKEVADQPRDASGLWVKQGGRVVVSGDPANGRGEIVRVDPNSPNIDVKLDNGKTITVNAKFTQDEAKVQNVQPTVAPDKALDTTGILSQPVEPTNTPIARLPEGLPTLTPKDITQLLNGWSSYVSNARAAAAKTPATTPEAPVTAAGEDMSSTVVDASSSAPTSVDTSVNTPAAPAAASTTTSASDQPTPQLTPETSDVTPKYLAFVSPDDPQAVMDVIAIVPSSLKDTAPATYQRKDSKWVLDPQALLDLRSATPPPVVQLQGALLNDVLQQVDGLKNVTASAFKLTSLWQNDLVSLLASLMAAGGVDRNRGNAEQLRHYWVHGEGAAKIRWGQPGDWSRCVRHLSKYLGIRAKGYCQLRHKEATGMYTATHAKKDRQAHHFSNSEFIMEEVYTGNTGTPTKVTDRDLLMPIADINNQDDELFDKDWNPDPEIEQMLNDEGCQQEMASFSTISDHSAEDPCWDGYKQIGFKDKNGRHVPNCVRASALTAAGGLDRNRGNAEQLRHYWTHGAGAAKIRWGTPGDWTRCVRHLMKYMGPRAKGYCQLRHKEATGVYTGSKYNPGNKRNTFTNQDEFDSAMIQASVLSARALDAKQRFALVAGGSDFSSPVDGARFQIDLLVPEEMESGDGRKFLANAIDIRELPLPLLWQIKTAEGHMGSVVVGRIDYMERVDGGIGNATGVFDTGAYGREAERLVRNGFLRGISADLDQFEASEANPSEAAEYDMESTVKPKLDINHARVMAATIVAKPAFQECSIAIADGGMSPQEEIMIPEDGIYEESIDPSVEPTALTASGFLTSEVPVTPPQSWFEKPALTKATPLTIDPDGRIYGHIAAWHVNHIGMPRSTRPPRSKSKYAYFHTGVVRTDSGKDIPVGQLTLAGGHASLQADANAAAKHYDDTASAIADVHAGEDDYGIWVAGSLRPDATEAQIRALRASAPSGDWRPVNGSLELVAVCQVNVPGFPIARALVASGKVFALVAAGAYDMALLKSDAVMSLTMRAQNLSELSAASTNVMSRAEATFGYMPKAKREELAKKGHALPDGSFPIENVKDLHNAVKAIGRAKDPEAAKKHIKKRARALGQYQQVIPNDWKTPRTAAITASVDILREKTAAAAAEAEFAYIPESVRMEAAKKGHALPDGSFPIEKADDVKAAIHAYGRAKASKKAAVRKHIIKRARQLKVSNLIPEGWKTAASAEASDAVANMRAVIASISDTEFATGDSTPSGDGPSAADVKTLVEAKAAADKETADQVEAAKQLHEDKISGKLAEEAKKEATSETKDNKYAETGQTKYTPETQPRDARGQYREVLARLSQHLGDAGLQDALTEAQNANKLEFEGNYEASQKASANLVNTLDRLDSKALNAKDLSNVKDTARDLGTVLSNLPLPFGNDAQKLRFSDLPAGLQDLMGNMASRVVDKIGKKDGDVATAKLREYMSGGDYFNQGEIQSEMSKMLRLLT